MRLGKQAIWFGLLMLAAAGAGRGFGQLPEPGTQSTTPNPLADTTVNAGKMQLFDLDTRFAKDVEKRGGAAFADWFAEDAVELGNGAAPNVGREAIARSATWLPKDYQLTWAPTDAAMGPSGDMGYTWGHFEGHSKDANGNPVTTSGRYITIWRKQADGNWKVVLDAGANEPAGAGDCCKLPGLGN
ncbi:MAG TPA: nuclear transport factor 2 family protein [Terracidiphilus sp.]|jgi:ketosteroid isomerase-like protein|nr:nuclear transport factor 2 family protein [Terracidiphilus sp.]